MTCRRVRRRLSEWIDGDLEGPSARELAAHLAGCVECRSRAEELAAVSRVLSELPRVEPDESVTARVSDRIEIEMRSPGLAFLFRGVGAARPHLLASVVSAALVLLTLLAAALALETGPLPEVHLAPGVWSVTPPSGTEGNPLFPSAEVDLPRDAKGLALPAEALLGPGEGTVFLETVVARDGTVSDVTLLDGDLRGEGPLLEALRRQRFEPVRYRGRPVAVSVYRLISRMEVRSPLT
jgi:hypothetical protein